MVFKQASASVYFCFPGNTSFTEDHLSLLLDHVGWSGAWKGGFYCNQPCTWVKKQTESTAIYRSVQIISLCLVLSLSVCLSLSLSLCLSLSLFVSADTLHSSQQMKSVLVLWWTRLCVANHSIYHKPAFFCSSLIKSTPTWLHPSGAYFNSNLEAKKIKYCFCINTDFLLSQMACIFTVYFFLV